MRLLVIRKYKKAAYTIGDLYIDGRWFCNTLEDTDRGLKQTMCLQELKEKKVYGETAIPTGEYTVLMDVVSPKYKSVQWYKSLCGGKMPRLKDVPAYEGVLIHPGNSALDSAGCLLCGKNTRVGQLTESRATFATLYAYLKDAHAKGETITIKIA